MRGDFATVGTVDEANHDSFVVIRGTGVVEVSVAVVGRIDPFRFAGRVGDAPGGMTPLNWLKWWRDACLTANGAALA